MCKFMESHLPGVEMRVLLVMRRDVDFSKL